MWRRGQPGIHVSRRGAYPRPVPGEAEALRAAADHDPGGPRVEKNATTETWSTVRFVSYADFPGGLIHPGNKGPVLDGATQGWATEKKLTILSKAPISLNGHPGREVNFEAQPGSSAGKVSGRARFYLVGGRLYHIGIAGPTGRVTPESIDQFLNSFALLDQGPQPSAIGIENGPTSVPRSPVGFYTIPEPATSALRGRYVGAGLGGGGQPGFPGSEGPTTLTPPTASAGGASIRSFEWIDENADLVGGIGDAAQSDGTKDQHLRMALDLRPVPSSKSWS